MDELSRKLVDSIIFENKEELPLTSLKKVKMTESFVKDYKEKYPLLKHFDYENDIGYAWVQDHTIVGLCAVDKTTKEGDRRYITIIEVNKLFWRRGVGTQLLKFCVRKLGANSLTVRKTNKKALKMYKTNGFKIVSENDRQYTMFLY